MANLQTGLTPPNVEGARHGVTRVVGVHQQAHAGGEEDAHPTATQGTRAGVTLEGWRGRRLGADEGVGVPVEPVGEEELAVGGARVGIEALRKKDGRRVNLCIYRK